MVADREKGGLRVVFLMLPGRYINYLLDDLYVLSYTYTKHAGLGRSSGPVQSGKTGPNMGIL